MKLLTLCISLSVVSLCFSSTRGTVLSHQDMSQILGLGKECSAPSHLCNVCLCDTGGGGGTMCSDTMEQRECEDGSGKCFEADQACGNTVDCNNCNEGSDRWGDQCSACAPGEGECFRKNCNNLINP